MYEISPSEPLTSLLKAFERIGGVLEYVLIGMDESDLTDELAQRHRAAAIFTVQAAIDRTMQYLSQFWPTEKARWQKEFPGLRRSTLYRVQGRLGIQIRPELAKGQPISLAQFFALPAPYRQMPTIPSWLDIAQFTPLWSEGYPHAFLEPPYGLHRYEKNKQDWEPKELFRAINQQLFIGDINLYTVYQWSTDWVQFLHFTQDAGWGSYLWTVSHASSSTMFGLVAAATD